MTDPSVIEAAALAQKRAADPAVSAWVAANAGSGKTRVLTERVARLLLGGARPERILCLTYTRAAAAEMANRLSALLGGWALLPEPALREKLATLDERGDAARLSQEALAEARRLFARALETPGGLKIQTIHAFCGAALRRFPLEAGVSPDFAELDEPAQAQLIERALERLAKDAEASIDDAFDGVATHLAEEALGDLVQKVLAERAQFREPPGPATLCAAFGLRLADLAEDAFATMWRRLDLAALREAVTALSAGSKTDADLGAALALALRDDDPATLASAFLRKDGKPRSLGSLPTKATAQQHPWLAGWVADLAETALTALERANACAAAARAIALNRFGAAFLRAYEAEKRARAALDFDDLIRATRALLEDPGTGAWALFKLDGGIDHLLVDEAQDTAPEQWRLVKALIAEFAAGAGTREGRTLFVVGDEKQSIYSFQGAEPRLFGENADWFASRLAASPHPLIRGTLQTSFRSSPAILRAVDATFEGAAGGLNATGDPPQHVSAWPERGGRVDLWPVLEKEPGGDPPEWDQPVDAPPPGDPRLLLAGTIADEVARWWQTGEPLPGAGRPITPGDVMILLRRRGLLAPALVRALKRRGVPVAGADRIRIVEELAVKDLLATARVALNQRDDLSLAALLRSPLCGLSEDDLFALAHGRDGPLWQRLRAAPVHADAAALLSRMRDRADFLRPYEFFDAILTREGGRHRLLARLGTEAEEAIDELLAQALTYEASHTPSLEGFLAWLDRADIDIKREQDKAAGAVRVMTVHGAKGLEAPVVILPDTLGDRFRASPVIRLPQGGAAWRMPAEAMPATLKTADVDARQRQTEESRRLLYVAMTRAENWLIACGAGKRPTNGETWYGLVEAGLQRLHAIETAAPDPLTGTVLRVENGHTPPKPEEAASGPLPHPALPGWAQRNPTPPPEMPGRIAASALGDLAETAGSASSGADNALARLRGTAIHALLEELPLLPPESRRAIAAPRLGQIAPDAAADHESWIAEALGVLALPEAAPFFAPDAAAEIALSWAAPDGRRIAGRVDRLRVGARVEAVDFKTDAAPPETAAAVPEGYLRQMAVYEAALQALFPGRPVALSLLWTRTGRLMSLPPALLNEARKRLCASA